MGENPSVDNQTIVEIGPDMNPIRNYLGWDTFKSIRQHYAYIAIDCDQEQLKKFKDTYGEKASTIKK
jgi:hypothetical protein